MPNIAEDYVSPSLRWGIFKQDHPEASVEFHAATGKELGIPKTFGGDEEYCVATIHRHLGDASPIVAYKPVADAKQNRGDHPSDAWNVLCTKALGRALKRAGYPDTTEDLRVFVLYKQRLAEHEAIRGGIAPEPVAELGAPEPAALDMSGAYPPMETKVETDAEAIVIDAEEVTVEEAATVKEGDEWENLWIMEESHETLKGLVAEMEDDFQNRARTAHESLNGRAWPITSVSQFNTLLAQIKALHAEYEQSLEDEDSLLPEEDSLLPEGA